MSLLLVGDITAFEALCAAAQDCRAHPDEAQLEQLGLCLMTETLDVVVGTALEDHQATIAEGLIGAFHSIAGRLQRECDRAADEIKCLSRDFDGSEIADVELQEATQKAYAAEAAVRAVELIRDRASETYTAITGEIWTPWRGGARRTASTAAQIDAREALRAKRARTHAAADPGAEVVAFRGSLSANTLVDANRIYDALNWAHGQWPQMKLTTTCAPGAEQLAIKWAHDHHIDHIAAKPDFDRFSRASAPFRANDDMLALEPVIVLTLVQSLDPVRAAASKPSGAALNAGQKAEESGIRHLAITQRRVV